MSTQVVSRQITETFAPMSARRLLVFGGIALIAVGMVGIGIGTTLDSGTNNFGQSQIVNPGAPFSGNSQGANCKLDIYGEVVVAVGSCPQGQGHETTAAQVVADVLNISPDLITVRTGFDTERNVHTGFSGTYASQFAVSGLSAVHGAAQKLKAEMIRLGAFVLESKAEEIEFGVGEQGPELRSKTNGKSINYWGLANIVNVNSAVLPAELYEVTLNCRYIWRAPFKVPDTKRKYGNLTMHGGPAGRLRRPISSWMSVFRPPFR